MTPSAEINIEIKPLKIRRIFRKYVSYSSVGLNLWLTIVIFYWVVFATKKLWEMLLLNWSKCGLRILSPSSYLCVWCVVPGKAKHWLQRDDLLSVNLWTVTATIQTSDHSYKGKIIFFFKYFHLYGNVMKHHYLHNSLSKFTFFLPIPSRYLPMNELWSREHVKVNAVNHLTSS